MPPPPAEVKLKQVFFRKSRGITTGAMSFHYGCANGNWGYWAETKYGMHGHMDGQTVVKVNAPDDKWLECKNSSRINNIIYFILASEIHKKLPFDA